MKRALHLAERNKQLEREMTDIDQMALAVESECNNTVKANATKLNKYAFDYLIYLKSKLIG